MTRRALISSLCNEECLLLRYVRRLTWRHSLRTHIAFTRMFGDEHFTRFNDLSIALRDRLLPPHCPNHGFYPTFTMLYTASMYALTTAEDTRFRPAYAAAARVPCVLGSHVRMPLSLHRHDTQILPTRRFYVAVEDESDPLSPSLLSCHFLYVQRPAPSSARARSLNQTAQ